ncbi:MAG: N5-glutamine methyltransferase family protein [Candidatus Marinamargulisbacteria bacterium]
MVNNRIDQAYRYWVNQVIAAQLPDAEVTVLFIIEEHLNEKYLVLLSKDYTLTSTQITSIQQCVDRCIAGEPLSYILESAYFNGRPYFVRPGVLIPRPETEELVGIAAKRIQHLKGHDIHVFECGFGSGVISIDLALQFPNISFKAWDISRHAFDVACINQRRHDVANIEFFHSDFFDVECFDVPPNAHCIIVSNPPYISDDEYILLDDVVKLEPKVALVADNNGMAIILDLIGRATEGGHDLICEIGYQQRQHLTAATNTSLLFKKDLSGHDRFLTIFQSLE